MAVRTLDDHLRASAARTPGKTAIVAGDRRVTYAELDGLADGIAGGLIASGIERGDRVGVFLPNTVEGAASIYGVLRAGAAFSPLNTTMKAEKLGQVLADAGAAGIICESAHRAVVAAAAAFAPTRAHGRVRRRRAGRRRAVRATRRARGAALAARHGDRPGRADLHVRLDRQAEGRHAHAPEHDVRRGLAGRVPRDAAGRGRAPVPAALVRLRPLPAAPDHHGRRHARAREGLRLPRPRRRAARERGRHGPAGRADAVRRAARPARPGRPRAARAALPLEHGRGALGHDDRRTARDVPRGPHLLHVRPDRVQARVVPARRT